MNTKTIFIFLLLLNVIFLSIYTYLAEKKYQSTHKVSEMREQWAYTFINPLLECNIEYSYYNPGVIKNKLLNYIEDELEKPEITTVSYYFRSLQTGEYFWYNDTEQFTPASLLKLPLSISLLKNVSLPDLETIGLTDEVVDEKIERNYWSDMIEKWKNYSLKFLLTQMLSNSDNLAAMLLSEYLWWDLINVTYKDFWLTDINIMDPTPISISTSEYSKFFRVLYNASYLPRSSSEYILELLSKSAFKVGIRWQLPPSLLIANKFWERLFADTGERQIHDCGIVYLEKPYFLCIMTRGTDFDMQIQIIQRISKMVYDDMILQKLE